MLSQDYVLEEVLDEIDRSFDILEVPSLQEDGILRSAHCPINSKHRPDGITY